jgi:hypothetical protein
MREIGALAEQALDRTTRPERLWQINQLETLVGGTDLGQYVGDSGYTREGALAARAFVLAFLEWANQPLTIEENLQMTPLQILSVR